MTESSPRSHGGPGGLLHAALLDKVAGEGLEAAVVRLRSALQSPGDGPLLITGLRGGAQGLMLAGWHAASGRPAVVVAPDREAADRLADDLEVWLGPDIVCHLPQPEVLAFDRNSPDAATAGHSDTPGQRPCHSSRALPTALRYAFRSPTRPTRLE